MNQVIITGVKIDQDNARIIRNWLSINDFFAVDWVHPDGTIGYLDTSLKELTQKKFKKELEKIAKEFPFLSVGISWMSGSTGEYNVPIACYLIENGIVTRTMMPHIGHPPPKRYKCS